MAYDQKLADRARALLSRREGFSEKKMFGGLCFLLNGNMCCGIVGDELMVRVGADAYEKSLARAHAREMDFTGRPMRGFVYVGAEGVKTKRTLASWLEAGTAYAGSLPPK